MSSRGYAAQAVKTATSGNEPSVPATARVCPEVGVELPMVRAGHWVDYDAKCNALHRLASSANSSAKKRSRFKSPASTGL